MQQARNRGSSQKGHILKTTNEITLSGERLKDLPLTSEIRIRCLLLPFNIALKVLARGLRPDEEIKCIKIRKEEVKLLPFADDMII